MRNALLTLALLLLLAAGAGFTSATPVRGEVLGSRPILDVITPNVAMPPGAGSVAQFIVDGDPGVVSTTRRGERHLYVVAVLEGSVTYTVEGRTTTYNAGDTLVLPVGALRVFQNDTGVQARILESVITAPGTPPPAAVAPPPTQNVWRVNHGLLAATVGTLPARVDVAQQSTELSPGYRSPERVANGQNAIGVIAGYVTVRYRDGEVKTYMANQAFQVEPGRPFTLSNEGTTRAAYVATWLTAPGTPSLSAAPAAAAAQPAAGALRAPATGDGGLAAPRDAALPDWRPLWLIGAIGLGVAGVRLVGRRRRS